MADPLTPLKRSAVEMLLFALQPYLFGSCLKRSKGFVGEARTAVQPIESDSAAIHLAFIESEPVSNPKIMKKKHFSHCRVWAVTRFT